VVLRPADQLVALNQVDQAVVGKLRHQCLGHVPQRGAHLQRAGQPLADHLEQPDPLPLVQAAAPVRLARDDHHAGDLAVLPAQRYPLRAHERPGAVAAPDRESPFPGPAAQHLGS